MFIKFNKFIGSFCKQIILECLVCTDLSYKHLNYMGFWVNFKYGNVGYKWKLKRSRSENRMTAIKQSKIIKTFYRVFRTKKIQMSTEVLQVRCVCCVVSCFSHVWPCEHMVYSPACSLVQEILRQEYWSVSPCPSPGDLPNPGIETASLKSPALAGEFFTTRVTWTESESLSVVSDSLWTHGP